ncbi:MAG: hypothetical protein E6Q88_04295 [Lysobacteraceae bacterium]|nr:MAG: hypothetical protein E6Q88_04295 [Xanthomonadaceae bacterium]
MNMTSFSTGQPSHAFPPTADAVVSQWFEVAASFDSRAALPRAMAVCAVTDEGLVLPHLTMNSIEIELPGGFVVPFDGPMQSVLSIGFPCRWRINKPATIDPVTYVVFGTGITASAED